MTTATIDAAEATRPCDPNELLHQIGARNIMAISGLPTRCRPHHTSDSDGPFVDGIVMPVRYGYTVEIVVAANDTYTVRRVFTRGGRRWVKTEETGVYCDEVGEAAYRASCYLDT